jgi:hypothetical protein
MGSRRRFVAALVAAAAALTSFSSPAPAGATTLDECAQRVIRDWYSGGRVDNVYPLGCYRAAIRALPDDVLQYSNADQDIRRALAFARQGRSDPGDAPPEPTPVANPKPAASGTDGAAATPAKREKPASPTTEEKRVAAPSAPAVRSQTPAVRASVPYPIIALAGLAVLLLGTGAVGWLANRRSSSDR